MESYRSLLEHFTNDVLGALAFLKPNLLVAGVQTLFDLGVLLVVVELDDLFQAVRLLHHQRISEQKCKMELLLGDFGLLADLANSVEDQRHNFL